jgi:hypothetical protein
MIGGVRGTALSSLLAKSPVLSSEIIKYGGRVRISPNLVNGSQGEEAGIDSRAYALWFPMDLLGLTDAVRFAITWPEAAMSPQSVVIGRNELFLAMESAFRAG